jgi:transcriptional regulator with GAF, ATPase, and Fis domain
MSSEQNRVDGYLHASNVEQLHQDLMAVALQETDAHNGAIFLWDESRQGLAVDFHVVGDLTVTMPGSIVRRAASGLPNGIAFACFDQNEPYVSNDTRNDSNYAPYFLEVRSLLAVPIRYQDRPIGVITVSSRHGRAFTPEHTERLESLADRSALHLRRAQLYRASQQGEGRPYLIKGLSAEWLAVERKIEQVSPTDAPVFIHGESGTGKELVAHSIHFNSRRVSKPFITINCAAIPDTMMESMLFGHRRGAFTGATSDKEGEFQRANGGTLFLDELGELPLLLQAKLLRAIEQGEVQPLGSSRGPEHVDVRLICATNRDIRRMATEGTFRDDLYYRLSVMTLELPPLRSYKEGNLEVMAQVFLQQSAANHSKPCIRFSESALQRLLDYQYPGNVRELKNTVEHAVIMSRGDEIRLDDLPKAMREDTSATATEEPPSRQTLKELRELWLAPKEQAYLRALLEETSGNVRQAAELADVNPVTLYRLLKKRGLSIKRRVSS